jgi:hypothetical protein
VQRSALHAVFHADIRLNEHAGALERAAAQGRVVRVLSAFEVVEDWEVWVLCWLGEEKPALFEGRVAPIALLVYPALQGADAKARHALTLTLMRQR